MAPWSRQPPSWGRPRPRGAQGLSPFRAPGHRPRSHPAVPTCVAPPIVGPAARKPPTTAVLSRAWARLLGRQPRRRVGRRVVPCVTLSGRNSTKVLIENLIRQGSETTPPPMLKDRHRDPCGPYSCGRSIGDPTEAPLVRKEEQAWSVCIMIRTTTLRALRLHTTTVRHARLGPGLQNSPGGRGQTAGRNGPPMSAGLAAPHAPRAIQRGSHQQAYPSGGVRCPDPLLFGRPGLLLAADRATCAERQPLRPPLWWLTAHLKACATLR